MPPRKATYHPLPAAQEPSQIDQVSVNLAIATTQLNQVIKTQERVVETVYGNGKPGLIEQTKENTRVIQEILSTMQAITAAHAEEARLYTVKLGEEAKKQAARDKERRALNLQWKIAVVVAFIGVIGSIVVAIIGSDQIMALILKTH